MTPRGFLERKQDAALTDLQALVLLALAEHHLQTLSDLAENLRRAVPSVSMAAKALEGSGDVVKDTTGQPFSVTFFYLSNQGMRKVAWLLGKLIEEPSRGRGRVPRTVSEGRAPGKK